MLFGFSRDQAVPLWWVWQKVDNSTVWGVAGASFILGLPLLSGVTAFAATTSIATTGLALTYGMPILLRIVNRNSYLETGPFTLGRGPDDITLLTVAQRDLLDYQIDNILLSSNTQAK
ncbi:hypothetical protein ABBQ32_010932 [Trebouxia sp. C0010 RCD-2024]